MTLQPAYVSLTAAAVATLVYLWITGCLRLIGEVLLLWIKVLILGVVVLGGPLIGPFLSYRFFNRCMDAVERLITVGDQSLLALWVEMWRR